MMGLPRRVFSELHFQLFQEKQFELKLLWLGLCPEGTFFSSKRFNTVYFFFNLL